MKVFTIVSLLLSLNKPIVMPLYKNCTNNTGNTDYSYLAQASYNYTNENPIELGGVLTVYSYVYKLNIVINFKEPVEHATLHLFLTQPQTNVNDYDLNYISEFCTFNYASGNDFEFEIVANNTNVCYVTLVYSYEMIKDLYGYNWIEDNTYSPNQDEWIQNGSDYVNITQLRLDSVTLSTSTNYNTQLNSLIANTDTLESFLQSIVNNTNSLSTIQSYLSTINTNISTINTTLNNIKTTLTNLYNLTNNSFNADKWYASLLNTQSHIVDNISEVLSNDYIKLYPSEFIGGTGPSSPAQYVTIYDEDNEINVNYDKTKLKIIVSFNNDTNNTYYYVNVPVYDDESSEEKTFTESICVYNRSNTRIEWTKLSFKMTDKKITLWIDCFYNSLSSPNSTSYQSISTILRKIYITNQSLNEMQKLEDILQAINNISSDINIDTSDKDTVDTFFQNIKQQLRFPNMPSLPDLNLPMYFLKEFQDGLIGGGENAYRYFNGYSRWTAIIAVMLVLKLVLL